MHEHVDDVKLRRIAVVPEYLTRRQQQTRPTITSMSKPVLCKPLTIKHKNVGFRVSSIDNAKSNDSGQSFVIREIIRLKHRCP